jgi:hypothetical protein
MFSQVFPQRLYLGLKRNENHISIFAKAIFRQNWRNLAKFIMHENEKRIFCYILAILRFRCLLQEPMVNFGLHYITRKNFKEGRVIVPPMKLVFEDELITWELRGRISWWPEDDDGGWVDDLRMTWRSSWWPWGWRWRSSWWPWGWHWWISCWPEIEDVV